MGLAASCLARKAHSKQKRIKLFISTAISGNNNAFGGAVPPWQCPLGMKALPSRQRPCQGAAPSTEGPMPGVSGTNRDMEGVSWGRGTSLRDRWNLQQLPKCSQILKKSSQIGCQSQVSLRKNLTAPGEGTGPTVPTTGNQPSRAQHLAKTEGTVCIWALGEDELQTRLPTPAHDALINNLQQVCYAKGMLHTTFAMTLWMRRVSGEALRVSRATEEPLHP